ncbi:MAG: PilC/PilY family type IV pilus protein, partial [Porticoccus sp.]|nr:PilC/PilY family type IV pilus protein [Porticoccus sp.]
DPDGVRRYGLDGPMTIWREESDDDDINIEKLEGDHVYAYFGMRRGGNNYYAMDVTDKNNPVLMWTIFGGTPGFQDMGQSWSRPVLSRVNWGCDSNGENCTSKNVLFFSGGYDSVHDNATAFTSDDQGAAIYMVDALNGDLLWSAGNNSNSDDTHDLDLPFSNSMPGDVTVADMDGDGSDDILFAVDIQGHVWRIDFNSASQNASDFSQDGDGNDTGGQIANLQDTGTNPSDPSDDSFRRFYTGPTVSLSKKRGQQPFFVISVGSGYVAHPKEISVTDRLYAIFERDVFSPPRNIDGDISYTSVTNINLKDMTDPDADPTNPLADPSTNGSGYYGFYREATATGEKFLRRALTIFGQTLYTSYLPEGSSNVVNTTCGAEYLGTSRIYSIDFITGKSIYTGEYITLKHPGIAPEPAVLFLQDDDGIKTNLCVGTECESSKLDPITSECEEGAMNCLPQPSLDIESWRENI